MKFNKNILATAIVASLVSTGASAAVNLSATPVVPAKFAKELLVANGTETNAANLIDLTGKLGWASPINGHLFIRVDLTNAKFKTTITAGMLTATTTTLSNVVSTGGTVGTTSVIFDATTTVAAATAADTFTLATPDLTVVDPTQDVTVTVKVFLDGVSAATNGSAVNTLTGPYTTAAEGLTTTFTALTETALATESFKKFQGLTNFVTANGTTTVLGVINSAVNTGVYKPSTGIQVAASDLIQTGGSVALAGQFAAAAGSTNKIFATTDTACSANIISSSLSAGNTVATFGTLITVANPPIASKYICFQADGTTEIPAQTVTASVTYNPATGATVSNASGTLGTIVHDGAELQSPWFSTAGGYVTRFVLVNSGTAAAPYTSRVITESGNVCTSGAGATGTIAAGQQLVVDATSICSSFSAATRASVQFSVAAPNNTIQGVYNIVNPTTGSVSNSPLVRPGTN